ncbi:tetratricopeptide repeat protein [Actinacidiphila epipremni]|uniref:Tetratricopeptide repeat protein n=1 Tax=Actinacidiphila epipremni TaxID=2053013 RepID=A0ABX0ZLJ0_9ACTN|nr:tetratricopeptide repeat protein [Actinacidiphila epipremni]NJP43377.1 tetratricopeptide repeat protein [Actinacidiphila epipremni]
MLDEGHAELAARGAEAVVAGAVPGEWTRFGDALAGWFSRFSTSGKSDVLLQLAVTVTELSVAREQEATRAHAREVWTDRLGRVLEALPAHKRAMAALALRNLLEFMPVPASSAVAVAVGADVAVTAPGERAVTAAAHGDVRTAAPAPQPVRPAEPLAAQHAGRDIHVQSSGSGMAVGHAQTVHFYQAAAPSTPVRLPYRIGRVPDPAPYFIERELLKLLAPLKPDNPRVVLAGTAGTGKTQEAVRIAEQAWDSGDVRLLLWVDASSRASILAAYARAAQDLYGRGYADPAEGATDFLNWLRPAGGKHLHPWLIVLDGVTDPAHLDGLWPPANPVGRVVATSRRRDFTGPGRPVVLPMVGFATGDIQGYLERALEHRTLGPPEEDLLAERIAEFDSVSSFAWSAARDILRLGLPFDTYLDRIAAGVLPEDETRSPLHQSIDAVQAMAPVGLSLPVLQLLALVEALPEHSLWAPSTLALLTRLRSDHLGTRAAEVTPHDVRAVLRLLHGMSMLDEAREGAYRAIWIEQRTRSAVRSLLDPDRERLLVHGVADALVAVWPDAEPDWEAAELLLDAVEGLLDETVVDALLDGGVHPVSLRAGHCLGAWGHPGVAEDLLESVRPHAYEKLGSEHPDSLKLRALQARYRGARGDDFGAVAELTEVLAAQRATLAADHPDVLTTRHDLAWCRLSATSWDAEEPRAELAAVYRDRARVLGPDHADTLRTLTALVGSMVSSDDSRIGGDIVSIVFEGLFGQEPDTEERVFDAVKFTEALLAQHERILGPSHPRTFSVRGTLGWAQFSSGSHTIGRFVLRGAVAAAEHSLAPEHGVALGLRFLDALTEHEVRRTPQAVEALAAVYAETENRLGKEHPDALEMRGHLLERRGVTHPQPEPDVILAEGVALLADAERVFTAAHLRTREALARIAHAQTAVGEKIAAIATLADLATRCTRALGPDHSETLRARHDLAVLRGQTGDVIGAVAELASVLSDRNRVLGPTHTATLAARRDLAWFRGEAGDVKGAIAELKRLAKDRARAAEDGGAESDLDSASLRHWEERA